MPEARTVLRGTAWVFYAVFVFEILFMISPAALYFYSAYGPVLSFLDRSPATAWLTQFFLPHISTTASPVLNALGLAGGVLLFAGLAIFLAGAVPLYWAKIRRRGAVTGGIYKVIRHPQYVGLAVMGVGTLLIWPRFLVLVMLVTMLFLYGVLARWEEAQCAARFGDSYRAYQARTGMFLPRALSPRLPRLPRAGWPARIGAGLLLYAAAMAAAVSAAYAARDYALSQVSAVWREDVAVLSPARLADGELEAAWRLASGDARVQAALAGAGAGARPARLVAHVVPQGWALADLPLEATPRAGHHVPADFPRNLLKVLISRPRSHAPAAAGEDIVKTAHGLDPIVIAAVDIAAGKVAAVTRPPPHVHWGDIPTPMF